jgi:hypothetical protein
MITMSEFNFNLDRATNTLVIAKAGKSVLNIDSFFPDQEKLERDGVTLIMYLKQLARFFEETIPCEEYEAFIDTLELDKVNLNLKINLN